MRRTLGFSLIELLVVIAIIAILAAIAFPVYSRAKDAAFRSDDISSMNQLRVALQLYHADQGGYPPQLLGYVTLYTSGPQMGQVIPAQDLNSYLYKRRVGSISVFQPSYNNFRTSDTTYAYYPNQDPRPTPNAPIGDLNGDGAVTPADDNPGARQAFGPPGAPYNYTTDPSSMAVCLGGGIFSSCTSGVRAQFYSISGYDVSFVKDGTAAGLRPELRYTLFWTQWGLSSGSSLDDPRQLGYAFPPEDTVITWNSYFRELGTGSVPAATNRDIVLLVGGSARPADSKGLYDRSWRYEVNP
jgi:prepilin-type N-terminal cleavage/methylation domain-containing protein